VDGAATVWPVLALCDGRRFVGLAYPGVKQALLVLPFSFYFSFGHAKEK
jgi:hypothetical protein